MVKTIEIDGIWVIFTYWVVVHHAKMMGGHPYIVDIDHMTTIS